MPLADALTLQSNYTNLESDAALVRSARSLAQNGRLAETALCQHTPAQRARM